MRFIGALTGILVTASLSLMLAPAAVSAQETSATSGQATDDNTYRAEILIVERKVAPSEVAEKMASRHPEPAEDVTGKLWVEDQSGQRLSDLNLVPRKDLYLSSAADRLERSGRFKVLAAAGWVQSFPPDYKGEKMRVAVGDWMDQAQQREIEGYISIDRLRFLHVTVALNHWQPVPSAPAVAEGAGAAHKDQRAGTARSASQQPASQPAQVAGPSGLPSGSQMHGPAQENQKQLLTWIRETRRMRSEEIHYLDSPTIGVLVYFKPIEPKASPTQ
ncbi:MAG: CsiV family protein [Marinobacter sp.]|nr:CsiV family protein [Marinobacter sp.]